MNDRAGGRDDDNSNNNGAMIAAFLAARPIASILYFEVRAQDVVAALNRLEAVPSRRPPVDYILTLEWNLSDVQRRTTDEDDDDDDDEQQQRRTVAQNFPRFVDILGRGDLSIVCLQLVVKKEWNSALAENVLERFFGQVLPTHRRLRSIDIRWENLPARYARLLTESLTAPTRPTTRLHLLWFRDTQLRHDVARAIADMVDRGAPLEDLRLDFDQMAPEDGARIIEAIVRNTRIQHFTLYSESYLSLDDLSRLVPLRELDVRCNFPLENGIASMAEQLRTNTTLQVLELGHVTPRNQTSAAPLPSVAVLFRPIVEALETYNFTLTRVTMSLNRSRVDRRDLRELMCRNQCFQRALEQMEPRNYRVEPESLVPRVLGWVSDLPTLLYRFLRRGDAYELFYRHLVGSKSSEASAGGHRKRGRPGDAIRCS